MAGDAPAAGQILGRAAAMRWPGERLMKLRRTSRLILLDEFDRVLLFRVEDATVFDPNSGPRSEPFWVAPGGSLEADESHEDAGRRELWEETGIAGIELGPWVATAEPVLDWKGELLQLHDRFYLVRVTAADVTLDNLTDEERAVLREHRWWSIDDLRSSGERVVPTDLGDLLARLIAGDMPDHPLRLAP